MQHNVSMNQKQKEIDQAWEQHYKNSKRIPSKREVFEWDERKRKRGRWH